MGWDNVWEQGEARGKSKPFRDKLGIHILRH